MVFMSKEDREALRRDIARQTEEFLRKGGTVVEVTHGISGIGGNGLLNFKINNAEHPQPRSNNGLFSTSTKTKNNSRVLDDDD